MNDSALLNSAQQSAFEILLSRQSSRPLVEPVPSQAELDLIFEAALRAPDHGRLRPWRFVIIRDEARAALGELFVQASNERDPGGDNERFRSKVMDAPMIVALGAHIEVGHKIPEIEQVLSVAAGTMNLLNALHILGYAGFWATGPNSYDEKVKVALGFEKTDRLLGFLYVGTPKPVRPVTRTAPESFVREWREPIF